MSTISRSVNRTSSIPSRDERHVPRVTKLLQAWGRTSTSILSSKSVGTGRGQRYFRSLAVTTGGQGGGLLLTSSGWRPAVPLNIARGKYQPPPSSKKENYPAQADESTEVNKCSSKLREGGLR